MWKVILARGDIAPTTLLLFWCYQFLDYSSVQWLCQQLEKNVCPKHAWFEYMRQMINSGRLWPSCYSCWPRELEWMHLPKVTMGISSRTRSWLIELVYSPWNNQSLKGHLSLWWIFLSRLCFFKRWWNIIKEHVHYWCLSRKFLLTSASFHLYNAIFNESIYITLGKSYSCIICNMNHLFYPKQR